MNTLEYVINKYNLKPNHPPTEIGNMGRDNLPELFNELGFVEGVEMGVERGVYAEILCKGIPDLHLYCVDSWLAYSGYREHVSQSKMDRFFEQTKERLAPYNVTYVRKLSVDAAKDFEDNSLDFVYIDGNHQFPYIADDLFIWSQKVRPGGIVSGHDYVGSTRFHNQCHVMHVLNAFTQSYKIRPWFIVGTKEKYEGEIRDKSRSWFYVKEGTGIA